MTVVDLILVNKERYTKVFLIENDKETNKAIFREVNEDIIKEDDGEKEAKDYFMLDKEAIDEIFGNSDELQINDDDLVLLIGI